ncbi:MAG: hypothetical protein ABJH82_05375 [Polaribacter sp.]|uniref:hypothetical protein n=1 Tax=Polaribacter sp. TaxID=1920175 RepID=UPI003266BF21
MSNTIEAIHLLQGKLESLLSNYEFLKNENEILLQSNTKLQHQIIEREKLIAEQKKQYDLLKIAKTIEGSSTNTRDTKLKINALIREIDKCIIQLHE